MRTQRMSAIIGLAAASLGGLLHPAIGGPETGQSASPAAVEEERLLLDCDFEQDAVGPLSGKLPAGWARSYGDPSVLEIREEPAPGSAGDKSLKIGANEKQRRGGVLSPLLPVDPQRSLKVSLWLKDDSDSKTKRTPYVGVAWYDARRQPIILVFGTKVNYTYLNIRKQSDWQLVSQVLRPFREDEEDGTRRYYSIPAAAAFFQLRVFVDNNPFPAWLDDVQVFQRQPPPDRQGDHAGAE